MDDFRSYPFVGWVPCLSGHLFFDLSQCGLSDGDAIASVNHEEAAAEGRFQRSLVVASKVDWKDRPETPAQPKPRLEGKFNVLLVARHLSGDDHLVGTIQLVPADLACKEGWCDVFKQTTAIQHAADKGDEVAAQLDQLDQQIDEFKTDRVWSIRFHLNTRGFVWLRLDLHGEQQPSNISAEVLSRQAYYYIKYSFHIHQHHHDSVDSLTTVHSTTPLSRSEPKIASDDLGKRMIIELKRSLVDLKRNAEDTDYRSLVQTSGVVAYAKSLVIACHAEGMLSETVRMQEMHYLDNLDASVQNKVRAINESHNLAQEYASRFRSVVLLLLALIAPVTLVYRNEIANGSGDMPLVADVISRMLHGQWTLLILLIMAVSYSIVRLASKPRKLYAPAPWYRRLRTMLRDTVSSKYKGDVLWWTLILIGAAIVIPTLWQIIIT